MTVISAVVLLGILIFVHELGHFLLAKLMGVKVEKFSLGFGPKVVGKKYGDTEYLISAFPLGGYVKMLGEDSLGEEAEPLSEEDKKRAYNNQPVRKRFPIILAGPLFNIVFAALVYIAVFINGAPALLPEVGEVMEDTPAARAGLRQGDLITRIGDKDIASWSDMTAVVYESPGKALDFGIKRGAETFGLSITPEIKTVEDIFGEERVIGLIGIKPSGVQFTMETGVFEAVYLGVRRTVDIAGLTVVSIIKLIQRAIPAKTIGGPILIFQLAGEQAAQGVLSFLNFMAVISISLGIINLFPIPVLDGGHLVFLGVEAIRRKPLNEKTVMLAQKVGLVLILMLMAFATYNDIMRWLTGDWTP